MWSSYSNRQVTTPSLRVGDQPQGQRPASGSANQPQGLQREVSVRSINGAPDGRRSQHAPRTAAGVRAAVALMAAATLTLAAACSGRAAGSLKAKAATPAIPAAQVTITPASG